MQSPLARRWWLNVLLLVIISGLAVFAWHRSNNPSSSDKNPLTTLSADSIHQVSIERNEETTTLERTDAGWRLTSPVKARADNLAVESLLRLARAPIESTITPADGDLSRYGLDRPSLRVRFNDTEIRFGHMHPLRENHYVQHGNAVHLVASRYYGQAANKYNNLIDSRLIEPGRKLTAIKLPGFSLVLKDGTWQRQPEITELSSDLINAFIDNWQHARALQVEKATGRRATEQVVLQFDGEGGQPTSLTIAVISRKPELILVRQDEGLEYRFPAETADRLFNLTADNPK